MTTKKKALLVAACAIVLILASVIGTLAYLTSQDAVKNTFTVGDVQIDLDEAIVDEYGVATGGRTTDVNGEEGNAYKLIPGHTYVKDPTVTVKQGSEECYVRALVTINNQAELDAIFAEQGGFKLDQFFVVDTTDGEWQWELANDDQGAAVRVYEFRYKTTVDALQAEQVLDPLFDELTVPKLVNNAQLASLNNLSIDIVAQAIQADGFADADAAWVGFADQAAWGY